MDVRDVDAVAAAAEAVDGWLARSEGELLYRLAAACTGRGAIVEIGSWQGKSTIWLASGAKRGRGVKVYAIDPHVGSPEHHKAMGDVWTFDLFQQHVRDAGVDDVVVPVVKTSVEAAATFDGLVELLFIDGAHEVDLVWKDFEVWFPKLVDGGLMAFHDTVPAWGFDGPRRVVDEVLYRSNRFVGVQHVHGTTWGTKVQRNGIADRLRNRGALLSRVLRERWAGLRSSWDPPRAASPDH